MGVCVCVGSTLQSLDGASEIRPRACQCLINMFGKEGESRVSPRIGMTLVSRLVYW